METSTGSRSRAGATPNGLVLLFLLLAYIMNFVDRQIIGILAVPIKAELGLTDTELGLMGGVAFALFYSALGIPIAWLADRRSRVNIIATAVACWSVFTALCGVCQNFWQLFLARVGVGIGEAGGVAPSYSLIADYFPPHRRARALAVFSFGSPIGSALGVFLGGWITTEFDWRAGFIVVGVAGLPLALLVRLCIQDPVRGGFDRIHGTLPDPAPPFPAVAGALATKRSFWLLSLGAACSSIVNYGVMFWLPSFFQRSFKMELAELSIFYGATLLLGGVAGMWLGGWLGDRAGRTAPAGYAIIPASCFLLAAPLYAFALFAPTLTIAFFLFLLAQALGLAWVGPGLTALQHIVAPNTRTTASASFLFINNLIGIGFGILFLGMMSDMMNAVHGAEALKYSILYSLGFYLVSALLFLFAAPLLRKDWHGDFPVGSVAEAN
jgi:MFS family permease